LLLADVLLFSFFLDPDANISETVSSDCFMNSDEPLPSPLQKMSQMFTHSHTEYKAMQILNNNRNDLAPQTRNFCEIKPEDSIIEQHLLTEL